MKAAKLRQPHPFSILDISAAITIIATVTIIQFWNGKPRSVNCSTSQTPILPDVCRSTAIVRLGIASPPPTATTYEIARRKAGH